jgi:RHS repeat-associated protein
LSYFLEKHNTGKERDEETGLYYFGARYLNPQTSMWLSVDPAMGEYVPVAGKGADGLPGMGGIYNSINMHVFAYAGNNPVKYTDPDGRAAGDKFDTMDAAAIDFAVTYNDDSIRTQKEYGSSIYQDEDGKYYYTKPNVGGKYGVKMPIDYTQRKPVAVIHTHIEAPGNDNLSEQDKRLSRKLDVPSYMVAASGILIKYDESYETGSGSRDDGEILIPSNRQIPKTAEGAVDPTKSFLEDVVDRVNHWRNFDVVPSHYPRDGHWPRIQ